MAFLYDQNINSDYEGQSFDIVVKVLSSEECYAMTGDTYAGFSYQGLRNIYFRIVETKFLVRTQAMSGKHKSKITTFTIANTGRHRDDIHIVGID